MRIIAGTWRGRTLVAPAGEATRPTSDRARQALFDMLLHAPWGGRGAVQDARVLDAFAGTGALGLEALSRGAAHATFMDTASGALAAIRANVAACRTDAARVLRADATKPPPADQPCGLLFLDPPYALDLAPPSVAALAQAGWLAPGALVVIETSANEPVPALPASGAQALAERRLGAARLTVCRWSSV